MNKTRSSRQGRLSPRGLVLLVLALGVVAGPVSLSAQTTYNWTSTSSGSWSSASNWSTAGDPGAGDTANLVNLSIPTSAGLTVTYDAAAPGTIGTLNFYNSSNPNAGNYSAFLSLAQSLTITNAAAFYQISGTGLVGIVLNGTAGLTVASGATFTLGSSTTTNLSNFATITQAAGYTGAGLVVNGTFTATGATSAAWTPPVAAKTTFNSGSVLNIDSEGSGGTRMTFTGDFVTTGSVTVNALGDTTAHRATSALYLTGTNITIGTGTTFVNFSSNGLIFNTTSATTQNISLGALQGVTFRNSYAGTATQVFSSSASSGTATNLVNTMALLNGTTGSAQTVQLGSNLTLSAGQGTTFTTTFNPGTLATSASLTLDLNGYTFDGSTATGRFSASNTSLANADYFYFKNSGASSIANGQGIFKTIGFNMAGADIGVGAGVILQATTAQGNDFGQLDAAAPTTIDPTSIIYVTSTTGTGTIKSTNNRAIGQLVVGTGTSATLLQLLGAVTAQGLTTVNAGAILDLGGFAYATTGLSGTGTTAIVKNSGIATAPAVLTINASGTNTYAGAFTDSSTTNTLGLTLGSTSTGTQILSGSVGYRGATTVNGGTLLMTGTATGGGAVVVNSGGRFGGAGGTLAFSGVTVASGGGLSVSGGGSVTAGTLTLTLGSGVLNLSAMAGNGTGGLTFVLGSSTGTSDKVVLNSSGSTINIGTGLLSLADFNLIGGSTLAAGTYILFDTKSATGITGSLASTGLTGTLNGYATTLALSTDGSGFQDIIVTLVAVPEPSVLLLGAFGVGVLFLAARRRVRFAA